MTRGRLAHNEESITSQFDAVAPNFGLIFSGQINAIA